MSDKKLLLKEILLKKQSQNTKQVEYCELFKTRSFGGEHPKFFQKQRDYSHLRGDEENITKWEISPSDGEIRQVCKILQCNVFSSSQKLFTAIKKSCPFCSLINLF